MSEKQFVCIDVGYGDDWYITDNGKRLSEIEIVDLLNEQQTDLNYLAKFIGEFKVDEFKEKLRTLRTLEDKVDEQQATIKKLEEENKKLRKELNDCEKFRYTVFKRIGDVLDE